MKTVPVSAGALATVLVLVGCFRPVENNVFDLPCGEARLLVHEHFAPGFNIDRATFELRYAVGGKVRVVDVWKAGASLYADPTPEERYRKLRETFPKNAWTVFVCPNSFVTAEYQQIAKTLSG